MSARRSDGINKTLVIVIMSWPWLLLLPRGRSLSARENVTSSSESSSAFLFNPPMPWRCDRRNTFAERETRHLKKLNTFELLFSFVIAMHAMQSLQWCNVAKEQKKNCNGGLKKARKKVKEWPRSLEIADDEIYCLTTCLDESAKRENWH